MNTNTRYRIMWPVLGVAFWMGTPVIAQVVMGSSMPEPASSLPQSSGAPPLGALASITHAISGQRPLLQWKQLAIRPHFSYSMRHGSGILRLPGVPEETTMQTIGVGVTVQSGDRLSADYTVTRNIYSSRFIEDTNNHNAQLSASFSPGVGDYGVAITYGSNSPTLVETGGQTREKTLVTTARALYDIGTRSAFQISFSRKDRDANPLYASTAWTGSDWVQWSSEAMYRYRLSPRMNVGIGLSGGYDEVSNNPDITHYQPQLQISWQPTDKIALSAKGGREVRSSSSLQSPSRSNNVYSAGVQYAPFPITLFSVSASQNVSSSYFSDQNTKNRGWSINLNQRVLRQLYATAGFSRGSTAYLDTSAFRPTGRNDTYTSFNAALRSPLFKRGSVAVTYQQTDNTSDTAVFQFDSETYGFEMSYRF